MHLSNILSGKVNILVEKGKNLGDLPMNATWLSTSVWFETDKTLSCDGLCLVPYLHIRNGLSNQYTT